MSGTSWFETRKLPLVSVLEASARGTALVKEKASPEEALHFERELARISQLIAQRRSDEAFHVTVRHIGGADDPFASEVLEAEEIRERELARIRARRAIADAGGTVDEHTLFSFMHSDAEWRRKQNAFAKRWIEAGLVDGHMEYTRLMHLGGPGLLGDAVAEVKAWQNVSFSQGEA